MFEAWGEVLKSEMEEIGKIQNQPLKKIRKSSTDDIKNILKIRLHMWDVKTNYPKNDTDTIHPIFRKEEDATGHVLDCEVEL